MAVTLVREVFDGRDLGVKPGAREAKRAFVVECDTSTATTAFEVQTASHGGVSIPQIGNPLLIGATATGLVVTDLAIKPNRSPFVWRVEVSYGSDLAANAVGGGGASSGAGHGEGGLGGIGGGSVSGTENPGNIPGGGEGGGGVAGNGTPAQNPAQIDHPLLRPIQAQYRTIARSEIMKQRNGAPLLNSAGDMFDPPLERERAYFQMTITHNTATFDRSLIRGYVWAINETAWAKCEPKTWLLRDLQATLRYEHGLFYWERTFTFEHDPNGWNPVKVLDAGWNELDGGDRTPITLDKGRTPTRPVLLDGAGAQLDEADDPVYLEFDVYEEVEFADLGLS